jgi:cyclic dehypoxanthinyl futalosine synthase
VDTKRIDRAAALDLLQNAPLIELMERGHARRQELHPGNEVTFVVDTNPNYTNVCETKCSFCSFYRNPGHPEAYVLTPEEAGEKVRRAQTRGATTVLLQGGHHPDLPLSYYLDLIAAIQRAAPEVHLHLFSPTEIDHIASVSGKCWEDVLQLFRDAGLETMPGGGAEILVEGVRSKVSPKKTSARDWLAIMGMAHRLGFKTSATMTYGHLETEEDVVEHLLRLRAQQDETGGFYAFIPWSFKPGSAPLSRRVPQASLPSYYARIIALSRLVLDNIPHIQASWFGEGWRAGQIALHAGADDFGGLLLEENVLKQAQHAFSTTLDDVRATIGDAGFIPVQRTTRYEKIETCFSTLH